jgi:hypothetical protein
MKQGRVDMYIPFTLMSSNSGWHKGWFYLKNDPDHVLSEFTISSISQAPGHWSDGPPTIELEKLMKEHWAVLTWLLDVEVDLAAIIRQCHTWGIVPL